MPQVMDVGMQVEEEEDRGGISLLDVSFIEHTWLGGHCGINMLNSDFNRRQLESQLANW